MIDRTIFTKNLPIKVLSLVLATALWVMATGSREEERNFLVPVTLVNTPEGLSLGSDAPRAIELTVVARRIRFLWVHPERMTIELDLKKLGEGTVIFGGMEKRLRLPPEFTVTRLYPAAIQLKLVRSVGKRADQPQNGNIPSNR